MLCEVREIEIFSRWFDRDAKNGRVSKVDVEIKPRIDSKHLINQGKREVQDQDAVDELINAIAIKNDLVYEVFQQAIWRELFKKPGPPAFFILVESTEDSLK